MKRGEFSGNLGFFDSLSAMGMRWLRRLGLKSLVEKDSALSCISISSSKSPITLPLAFRPLKPAAAPPRIRQRIKASRKNVMMRAGKIVLNSSHASSWAF